MKRSILIAILLCLVVASPAAAQDQRLEAAKEEAGSLPTPVSQLATPVGRLQLERAELLAARHDQPVRFTLTLDRDVERGTIRIALPQRWRDVPESGLRPSTAPRGRRVGQAREAVELVLDGASAGDQVTGELRDRGIPAGTYELPVTFGEQGRAARRIGRLEIVFYAPVREAAEQPWDDVRALNVSDSGFDQSETFLTVVPGNPDRVLASANGGMSGYGAWISNDGGDTWLERPMPRAGAQVSGEVEPLNPCCDPMSAADAAGNIWYGGLDYTPDSRIIVGRIAAGTNDFVNTVAIPARTTGVQDKPMMTIDGTPGSPTFGRLYVIWNEPASGGINVVVSQCDTRPDPANCDDVAGWTTPVTITKGGPGGFIYADVAVGPDGKVFATWWNYSAANAIEGATCSSACDQAASWSSSTTIATLDATGAQPVPFACPILAQPGGRASTGPNVEVSRSDGRVYVAWSDLRAGSGSTRCDDGLTPAASHLTFDSLVKSAAGTLPVAAAPATKLIDDGAGNHDDWFPWLAVDQSTGIAYAAFYSTRDNTTRKTTNFYARSVGADGSLGALVRVSEAPSDYSANPCCGFGNDYGDYAGIDATGGFVYPIWSEKSSHDGEAMTRQMRLPAPGSAPSLLPGAATVTDAAPGGDDDGVPEPGEVLSVAIPVTNAGAAATSVEGTLTTTSDKVLVSRPKASYGDVGAGADADAATYRVALADDFGCGADPRLRLRVDHAGGGSALERYSFPTGGAPSDVATTSPNTPIPDATGQAVSPLAVAAPGTIGDVDVAVNIRHTYVGDLVLVLVHPDGTEVVLETRASNPRNGGDNLTGTIFDDEAAASFGGAAPFTGSFRPDDPLSLLDGKPWAGTWNLIALDRGTGDVGTIDSWSLRRHTCSAAAPNQKPTVSIAGPDSGAVGQALGFTATGADPDGAVAKYEWDLDGNGSFETDTGLTASADTVFGSAGAKTVAVRVMDDEGATTEASRQVTIASPAPPAPPAVQPPPRTVPLPTIALVKPGATLRARKGRLKVALRGCGGCRGQITLTTQKKVRLKRGAKAKRHRIGRTGFTVRANGTVTVTVRLTKAGKALLRRMKRIPLKVALIATDASGRTVRADGRIKLRR